MKVTVISNIGKIGILKYIRILTGRSLKQALTYYKRAIKTSSGNIVAMDIYIRGTREQLKQVSKMIISGNCINVTSS